MNTRIERLNKLMDGRAFFIDPVGLSDEQNEIEWDKIIQNDRIKATYIQKMTKELKNNNVDEFNKIQKEYNEYCENGVLVKQSLIDNDEKFILDNYESALTLLRRIAKKGEFMDREGLRLVVEDWLNRRNLLD